MAGAGARGEDLGEASVPDAGERLASNGTVRATWASDDYLVKSEAVSGEQSILNNPQICNLPNNAENSCVYVAAVGK